MTTDDYLVILCLLWLGIVLAGLVGEVWDAWRNR